MSSSGVGSNSLSKISSILKYDTTNLNVGLGVEPINMFKLRVVNTSKSWQSAIFSTNMISNANAIGIGNFHDCNINYDINNSNNNATIYATSYTGIGFKDLFLNNFGNNSNLYGNVIIRGKTTIGSYYNSTLYNYSLDINGTSNILNLRNNSNTLNFSIDNSNNFNINTSSKKIYINNSLYTYNLNASNINISYNYPIYDTDKLVVSSGITKFENNSTVNIGSNNNLNNKLNVYGNLYISSNIGIGIEPDNVNNIKLSIAPGTTNFTNNINANSIVNIGNTGNSNFLNIYGKTVATSTIQVGFPENISEEFALKAYGNILFNNSIVGIGTTTADIANNNLNIYAKSFFAGNIGIGTTATNENTIKIKTGANTLFDSNSTIRIEKNSTVIIKGISHLNGNVIIGESNINSLNFGLYINSNTCINNGLTINNSNNELVDIKGNVNIGSNITIGCNLSVLNNINFYGTISGNGIGLSNIYLSSIIKDNADKIAGEPQDTPLINAKYINYDTKFFTATNGKLTFTPEFEDSTVSATIGASIWTTNQFGIYYNNSVSIGNNSNTAFSKCDSLLEVGKKNYFIKTREINNSLYPNYPYTQISSDDEWYSNTTIKLVTSYLESEFISIKNENITPGSIVYTTTGKYNSQHIFEYNNYNDTVDSNPNNYKKLLMSISKTGIVSINSNISIYVKEDNEKLIVNGSVNILNCNTKPTQLILGNSESNNSILNAHGTVFIGSNLTIGNSIYFNSFEHRNLDRLFIASGKTQFANNTNFNIGYNTLNINSNLVNIYSKIGIGINADKNIDFNNFIYGPTNFYGDYIRFGNPESDSTYNTKIRVAFINANVGIGTIGSTYDLSLYGNILIYDNSTVTFGSFNFINNNKFNIYSKIGIGTNASDTDNNILRIGSGNITTDNNINFNYGTINSNNFNKFNIYSKVGIGTDASDIDNIILKIGGNSNTINFLDQSTINFGTLDQANTINSPYVNIYGKLNINGSNTIKGNTIIGADDFTAITVENNVNLHIKTPTKFYDNVYFNNPIYFNSDVNFLQSVNFGTVDTVEFKKIKTSNLDASGGYISGFLSNSDSINNSPTFDKINVNKINIDSEYIASNTENKLTINTNKYSLWYNNQNNLYISYSNGVFITSNNDYENSYIDNNGTAFQVNVSTGISKSLHIGKKTGYSDVTNCVLYVYKSGIFYNSLYCSNTQNGNPSIFTNTTNTNILQIGTNLIFKPDIPNITGYQLNVNGDIGLTGNIFTNSDLRLKNNISTINNALEKIINCRGVFFNYLNDSNINIGVIAQEIEKIIPEVVETKNNGFKTVNYLSIIGILIEAIKELNNKINKISN